MDSTYIIVSVFSIAAGILITRLLGAWMLRINEVIQLQKDILNELRRQRTSSGEDNFSKPKGFVKPPKSGDGSGLFNRVDPNRKPL